MRRGIIADLLEYYYSEPIFAKEIRRALEEFFDLREEGAEPREIENDVVMGMFSEWLVYDFTMKNGKTLLGDFCENNPLGLPENELADYRELLENTYGIYEVLQVVWHKGLTLCNLQTKKEYRVKESSATEQAQKGQLVFARVGKVGNDWEMIGNDSPALSIKIGEGMRKHFSKTKDRFTPKDIYEIIYKNGDDGKEPTRCVAKNPEKAMDNFQRALKKMNMDGLIRAETVKKWIEADDRKENPGHYLNLLYGLTDKENEYDGEDIDELIMAFCDFYNSILQKQLEDESPNKYEAGREEDAANCKLEITEAGTGEWMRYREKAFESFQRNDPEKTLEYYNKCFESLLAEKTTEREIYRIFANKALAHFQLGEEEEGVALLEMALELNPNYDFARSTMERYREGGFANTIMSGRLTSAIKRLKDPDSPLNRWDYDKIKNKWPIEKILRQLKEYGIETDEKTFREKAGKFSSISDFSKKIFRPSYSGKDEDEDFVWMAVYGLWQRWCPEFPSIEFLSENIEKFWDTVLNERDKIYKKKTRKELEYFEEMMEKISPEFFERWKRAGEYQFDVYNIAMSLGRLAGTIFEERALALTKILEEKTDNACFLLPDICRAALNEKDWEEKMKVLNKLMPYEYRFYLEVAAIFNDFENDAMEIKCLKEALAVVEKRDRDKAYDLEDSASTVYEDYEDVLDTMENFYKERGNKAGISDVKEIRKKIKRREAGLSATSGSKKLEEGLTKLMGDLFQKRFSDDPANRYFQFLRELEINFATKDLTKSTITSIGPKGKIGRNDPCPCGSGKKYKKCCGK